MRFVGCDCNLQFHNRNVDRSKSRRRRRRKLSNQFSAKNGAIREEINAVVGNVDEMHRLVTIDRRRNREIRSRLQPMMHRS